jgi:ribosomal protein L11 methyltransferase
MRVWQALDVDLPSVEQGDLLQAALTDYHVAAIEETTADTWRVFFHDERERDRARLGLRDDFPKLVFRPVDVPDEDWAARSQQALTSVRVGRVTIAPPWDAGITVVIQPSMGFGTGHHATTRLCVDALQRIDVGGRTVLDVGTGSGVLAIVASRLGAHDVTGIDDDADAVHAAWDNLALNPEARVTLLVGDFRSTELVAADVVVANLTGGLLTASARRLMDLLRTGGEMVLSGLTTAEEAQVVAAFDRLKVQRRGEEDGWVALTLAR